MPKVGDLEKTGSVCMDAVQLNLVRDGCKLVNQKQGSSGVEIFCTKSKNGGEWTKKIIYITHPDAEMNFMKGFHPICIDRDIIVYVSDM